MDCIVVAGGIPGPDDPLYEYTQGKPKALLDMEGRTMLERVMDALQSAEAVEKRRGVKIEVIDLLTISPMDSETIVNSVKKTGRCVVVQEAPQSFSVSSEIVARINDDALLYLEAPVKRITQYDVVTPYFGRELMHIPDQPRIERGIEETLDF